MPDVQEAEPVWSGAIREQKEKPDKLPPGYWPNGRQQVIDSKGSVLYH
jgi:hypothetical protein